MLTVEVISPSDEMTECSEHRCECYKLVQDGCLRAAVTARVALSATTGLSRLGEIVLIGIILIFFIDFDNILVLILLCGG